jgi:hypothetical protein
MCGEMQQWVRASFIQQRVGFVTSDVGATLEGKSNGQRDTSRSAETANQRRVLLAERANKASGRDERHHGGGSRDAAPQEPSEQSGSKQAVAGLRVGLPVDQDLAAPEASRSDFLAPAEVGHQPRVGVLESSLHRG